MIDLAGIGGALREDASSGSVVLDRRTLPSRAALRLFDRLLGAEVLILDEGVVLDGPEDVVRIRGRASVLGIERCRTEVELTENGGDLGVSVVLRPPAGWHLGTSFPGVAGSDLDTMLVTEPRLTLRSHDETGAELTVRDALVFGGTVGLASLFAGMGPLLGNLVQADMAGPIRVARPVRTSEIDAAETLDVVRLNDPSAAVEVELSAAIPVSVDVPGFSLHDAALIVEGPYVVDWAAYSGVRKALRARVEIGGEDVWVEGGATAGGLVSFRARPDDLTFSDIGALAGLVPGADLEAALPESVGAIGQVRVTDLDVVVDVGKPALSHVGIGVSLAADWPVPGGFAEIDEVQAYFMASALGSEGLAARCTLSASLTVGDLGCQVTAFAPEHVLVATIPDLPLSAAIAGLAPDASPMLDVLPDLSLRDVSISVDARSGGLSVHAATDGEWRVPVGVDGLVVRDLHLEVNRRPVAAGAKQPSVTGLVTGRISLAGAEIEVEYAFPGDLVVRGTLPTISLTGMMRALAGTTALRDTPLPDAVLETRLDDVYVVIAPGRGLFQAAARTPLGEVEIMARKISGGSWGLAAGFVTAPGWRFAEIADELAAVDAVGLGRISLVVCTSADPALALTMVNPSRPQIELNRDRLGTLEPEPLGTRLQRGLNLFADFSLADIGASELLGVEQLQVYAAIGPRPADLVLEARFAGDIPLGPEVRMTQAALRLRPAPAELSIMLLGVVQARVGAEDLKFTGGLAITSRTLSGMVTMEGSWVDPLGLKDLTVEDVALELGLSFAAGLPTIAIAGSIQVGAMMATTAVRFDAGRPERSLLAVTADRLLLIDLIDAFCPPEVRRAIPAEASSVLTSTGLEAVEIYIAPMATRIGELEYEQGFRAACQLVLPGFRASAAIELDTASGVAVTATMSRIEIPGLLTITGSRGEPGPRLALEAKAGQPFLFQAMGRIELLGLDAEALIDFHQQGFDFEANGRVSGHFDAHVHATGSRINSTQGFWLVVEMQSDLMAFLREQATAAIQEASQAATRDIEAAQTEVRTAQAQLNQLDKEIERVRGLIRTERKRDDDNLRHLTGELTKAQAEVDKIKKEIDTARSLVGRERARDAGNLRVAQADVKTAQAAVDTLQRDIEAQKKWIKTLEDQIRAKKRWLDGKAWWDQTWAGPEYAAYAAGKSAEISVAYTKIGGIEAARGVAWTTLEAARAVVREIERSLTTDPLDSDPRVAAPLARRAVATGTLDAARGALQAFKDTRNAVPIDADPRVAGLFVARDTSALAIDTAHAALEGVKASVAGLADVSTFIAKQGLGGLVDVTRARFETSLAMSGGGMFDLQLLVSFMSGPPEDVHLSMSFDDPIAGAKRLADQLLTR